MEGYEWREDAEEDASSHWKILRKEREETLDRPLWKAALEVALVLS